MSALASKADIAAAERSAANMMLWHDRNSFSKGLF
jgi:hypothetical protein